MNPEPVPTLRILAGTRAAVRLAEAAALRFADRLDVAVALSGVGAPPHGCRVDAIGIGPAVLGQATAVIDGLDPFAREAVRSVREAARRAGIPRLTFRPPVWHRHPLDRWVEVRDLDGAVGAVASVARTVLLALPVALFATLGFMLPVATPPNAVIFGSGAVEIGQMLRAGVILDISGILIVAGIVMTLGERLLPPALP